MLCLDDVLKDRMPHLAEEERAKVEPTENDLEKTPVGNAFHRIVHCPRVRKNCSVPRPDLEKIFQLEPISPGDVRVERGLFNWGNKPPPKPHVEGTFHWTVKPTTALLRGAIYPDGSCLDGPGPLARGGWALVVVDVLGQVLRLRIGSLTSQGVKPGPSSRQPPWPNQTGSPS